MTHHVVGNGHNRAAAIRMLGRLVGAAQIDGGFSHRMPNPSAPGGRAPQVLAGRAASAPEARMGGEEPVASGRTTSADSATDGR